jgi:MFS family permease
VNEVVPGTSARRARVAVSLGFGAQGFVFAMILTSLDVFKGRYGIDDGTITLVILGVCIMAGVGTVVSDRIARSASGSRGVLVRGLVVVATAVVLVAASPSFAVLAVGFAVYGVGLGMVDSGTNMQAVTIQRLYGRSLLTGFYAAWSVGGILGTVLVAVATGRVSVEPVGWTLLVGPVVALGACLAVRRAAWREPSVTAPVPAPLSVDGALAAPEPESADKPVIPWGPLLILGLGVVAYYVNDQAISTWSPIFMHEVLDSTGTLTKLGYAAYLAMTLVSRLAGDPCVRRWGRVRVVRAASLLGAVGLVVVLTSHSPEQAVLGFAVAGAGLGLIAPLCFSSAGLLAPGHADAVIARLNGFNYLGAVLGGVFVGFIGTASSLRWGFLVPVVLVLAVAVLAGRFGVVRHEKIPLSAGAGA